MYIHPYIVQIYKHFHKHIYAYLHKQTQLIRVKMSRGNGMLVDRVRYLGGKQERAIDRAPGQQTDRPMPIPIDSAPPARRIKPTVKKKKKKKERKRETVRGLGPRLYDYC